MFFSILYNVEILLQENERSCVNWVGHNASNNDQDYSRAAQELSIQRQQLLQKANQSLSRKHPSVTAYYLEQVIIYLKHFYEKLQIA